MPNFPPHLRSGVKKKIKISLLAYKKTKNPYFFKFHTNKKKKSQVIFMARHFFLLEKFLFANFNRVFRLNREVPGAYACVTHMRTHVRSVRTHVRKGGVPSPNTVFEKKYFARYFCKFLFFLPPMLRLKVSSFREKYRSLKKTDNFGEKSYLYFSAFQNLN